MVIEKLKNLTNKFPENYIIIIKLLLNNHENELYNELYNELIKNNNNHFVKYFAMFLLLQFISIENLANSHQLLKFSLGFISEIHNKK